MPDSRSSYILVHLVERLEVGDTFLRTRSDWPLHITLVPWFYAHNEHELIQRIEDAARHRQSFDVTVGEDRWYGKRQEIPVNIIADQTEVEALHRGLLGTVRECSDGFHVDPPPFIEDRFSAHITHHVKGADVHRNHPGDVLNVQDVSLLRLLIQEDGQHCELIQNFQLGSHETAA